MATRGRQTKETTDKSLVANQAIQVLEDKVQLINAVLLVNHLNMEETLIAQVNVDHLIFSMLATTFRASMIKSKRLYRSSQSNKNS